MLEFSPKGWWRMSSCTDYLFNQLRGSLFTSECKEYNFAKEPRWILYPTSALYFIISGIFDEAIGLFLGACCCVTGGNFTDLNFRAVEHLAGTEFALKIIFATFVRMVNLKAEFNSLKVQDPLAVIEGPKNKTTQSGEKYAKSTVFRERHVTARVLYLFSVITVIVEKALVILMSIALTTTAICCLGKLKFLNSLAFSTLGASTSLVTECFISFLKTINPQATVNYAELQDHKPPS